MLKTPAEQMIFSTAAPVVLSAVCFAACGKKIKSLIDKLKFKDSNLVKHMLLPLALAMYAGAGYASFRIYLRSTFLGPPMSGTSKALSCCANKALVLYGTSVMLSLLWIGKAEKCVKKGLAVSSALLMTSLCAFKKFHLIDKVASKAVLPLTVFSGAATLISLEFYSLLENPKKSALGKKVSNFVKNYLNIFVSKESLTSGAVKDAITDEDST